MKYIIICGPTCSGKTALGVKLAVRFDGEIIGADSRQIYRYINIGTAKPAPDEYRDIKYHLIDFLELNADFSAYRFADLASDLINDIIEKGKVPIVVGGTGLYLKALTEGLFKSPEPSYRYRKELERICEKQGPVALHKKLAEVDPAAASKINPLDKVRLVRALEVYRLTGKPISELQQKGKYKKTGRPLWLGLAPPRKKLYENIDKRVDKMIVEGFEEEVLDLKPYIEVLRRKKVVGYTDMIEYLFDKEITKQQAIEKVKQHQRNYAKRQMTWFRNVPGVIWFDPLEEDFLDKVYQICDEYLKSA